MQKTKRSLEDYILYLVIGSIYTFAVNVSIINTTVLNAPYWMLFGLGVILIVFWALVFFNRITILVSLGIAALVGIYLFRQREEMYEFWYFINELVLLVRGYIFFSPEFNWPLIFAIAFSTGLFIAICLYVRFQFYLLAAFGAAIYIVCWLMEYAQSWLGFVLFLFCFSVLLIRNLQGTSKDGLRATLIAAPVCAVLVWIVSLMPIPAERVENEALDRFLNDPFEVVSEFFFLTFNPKYFSFQTTGFGGQGGRLGGPVALNNRMVMAVDAPRRVYLSGATHNVYTGYGWTTSVDREFVPTTGRFHPSYIEFLETSNALFRNTSRLYYEELYRQLHLVSYLPINNVDIFVGGNRTGSLFRPMRERGILFTDPGLHTLMLTNPAGDRRLETLLPLDAMYRYNFIDLDYREEHIQEILRASRRGIYRDRLENPEPLTFTLYDWYYPALVSLERYDLGIYYVTVSRAPTISVITGNYNILEAELSRMRVYREEFTTIRRDLSGFDRLMNQFNPTRNGEAAMHELGSLPVNELLYLKTGIDQDTILAEYADFVYENYLDLPDTLPERVINLAHNITQGYETNYDKIRALQEFLIQFPYTLTPNPVPVDRDFVDYFLFDGQEGFCVYYASAMVVMSRAIGVPARYAEGFLMPSVRDPYTHLFNVTNRNAHAWAEVYFEGFGWLVVETTAPYVFAMYERPFFAAPGAFDSWGFADMSHEEYLRMMGMWDMIYGMPDVDWDLLTVQAAGATPQPVETQRNWPLYLLIAAASLLSAIALYFGIHGILRFIRKQKVKRMNPSEQGAYYYREILKITDYWRYPVQEDETLHSYGQRIRYRFTFANESKYIRDLNALYYKAKYGAESLSESEAKFMKDCYYELVDYVRVVRPRLNYIYIRYVRRVIAL